jgi:hypothetical protein
MNFVPQMSELWISSHFETDALLVASIGLVVRHEAMCWTPRPASEGSVLPKRSFWTNGLGRHRLSTGCSGPW